MENLNINSENETEHGKMIKLSKQKQKIKQSRKICSSGKRKFLTYRQRRQLNLNNQSVVEIKNLNLNLSKKNLFQNLLSEKKIQQKFPINSNSDLPPKRPACFKRKRINCNNSAKTSSYKKNSVNKASNLDQERTEYEESNEEQDSIGSDLDLDLEEPKHSNTSLSYLEMSFLI